MTRRCLAGVLPLLLVVSTAARAELFARSPVPGELRAALGAWAAGDETRALRHLRAVDEPAGERDEDALRRAKLAEARSLARRVPLARLAMARLEERAYVGYAAERRARPALAARLMVAELVADHVRAQPGDRRIAAALLAELGTHLQAGAQAAAAEDVYQKALALDAAQPAALLGLGALYEKEGSYAAAAPLLEALVDTVPEDREARLRRALVLLRSGRAAEGERALALLSRDGQDWVRSLAAQEEARLLVARGAAPDALALLRAAAATLPCDPSLPVAVAFVAERVAGDAPAGGPADALPLDLAALGTCGDAAESARTRYTRPPTGERAALADELAKAEPLWRAALTAALPADAGEAR